MSPLVQQKSLGIGASCTVSIHFLHPKNKIKEVIPNQTASQKLSGLIMQGKEEKIIRKEGKECIVFRHEDFGGQLLWALQHYVSIDEEGPESAFFDPTPLQGQGAAGAVLPAAAASAGGGNIQQQHQALLDEQQEILPAVIQELIGYNHLDHNEELMATAAASMVDDDNGPAPENQPNPNENVDDIFSGWSHSGICHRRSSACHNMKPELQF